jgi:hypothetical protein
LKPPGTHYVKASRVRRTARAGAVHTITSCGYVAKTPGTYNVTRNLYDTGSGDCILVEADNVTLNLNSHTITGTGSDTCVYVSDTTTGYDSVGDSVVGGQAGSPRATFRHCYYGLYLYYTSGATASRINIANPTYGVYGEYAIAANVSQINVTATDGVSEGFYFEYGGGNTVSQSAVTGYLYWDEVGFETYYEYTDHFVNDTTSGNAPAGDEGYGFYDEYSNRDVFSGDKSIDHLYGFYLYEDGYGTVSAKNSSASDLASDEYGFYIYYPDLDYDYNGPNHPTFIGNTTNGFDYGYYDYQDTSDNVREIWKNNTADNYSGYGFYFEYPTDYTITGNTADANTTSTATPRWVSGTYGLYLSSGYSYYAPLAFSGNKVYDNEYGFYSDGYAITGTNNIAKRNKYASYDVAYNNT